MDSYSKLVADLKRVRTETGDQPSLRALGRQTKRSTTSITKWLSGETFPQDVEPLVKVLSAIRAEAREQCLEPSTGALPDEDTLRQAYQRKRQDLGSRIGAGVRTGAARRGMVEHRPGRAITQCDPILLGVRRGIDPDTPAGAASDLTGFVRRAHDGELRRRVAAGGVVTLLGGSSTGKSRSAWEAVRALSTRWRLWQPGSWADLQWVRSHTVIWLNDAHRHLSEDHAEQLARLVSDAERSPVTVLVTLWPADWSRLTADVVPGTADSHHWARTLLTLHTPIDVPDVFAPLDQHDLDNAVRSDPRWARAVREADSGAVVQYFAGVPALVDIYRHGSRMARALIEAAIDARRLGASPVLSQDFLLDAAIRYPSEAEWAGINGQAWPATALAEVSAPVRGLAGPLSPKAPRARNSSEPLGYVLAPYLEQLGRTDRAAVLPPESFWTAARQHLPPEDWVGLAASCDQRGLFRTGASFRRAAMLAGHAAKAGELLRRVPDAGAHVVDWLLDHAQTADLGEVQDLAKALTESGAAEATVELYRRAARDIHLSTWGISWLIEALVSAGDQSATAAFLARDPGHFLPPEIELLQPLAELDRAAAEQLVTHLTPPAVLGHRMIDALIGAGFTDRVAETVRAIPVSDDDDLIPLVRVLHTHGFDEDVRRLLGRGVPIPRFAEQAAVLLSVLDDLGDSAGVAELIDAINEDERLAWRTRWSPDLLASLPVRVRDRLALREPSTTTGTSHHIGKVYLSVEDEVVDRAEALRALPRAALDQRIAKVDPTDPFELLVLLRALGDRADSPAELVSRIDPDRLAMIPGSAAGLAVELGPGELARAILVRLIAVAPTWDSKSNRRIVIPALRTLGLIDLVDRLTQRYADGGDYRAFLAADPDRAGRFRYGREPDGTPSPRWGWSDLT